MSSFNSCSIFSRTPSWKPLLPLLVLLASPGCGSEVEDPLPGNTFQTYWYSGAEIARYSLEQVQYGESRRGDAVLIFITEPFLPETQVKEDFPLPSEEGVPSLKLNRVHQFVTGLYPYSLMSSTFAPIDRQNFPRALKLTASTQDWCGHSWYQFNRRDDRYHHEVRSYFQKKADHNGVEQETTAWLEEDLFLQIRLDPENLPVGPLSAIPSPFVQRLGHLDPQAGAAIAEKTVNQTSSTFKIRYTSIDRTVTIDYDTTFPHRIRSFEETLNGKTVTRAKLTHLKILPYWELNRPGDLHFRSQLGLQP
ncbi:MAG: septum formation inhibitor Maf [Puniceicoccaceae bacterium]